jgi:hypothetical protein
MFRSTALSYLTTRINTQLSDSNSKPKTAQEQLIALNQKYEMSAKRYGDSGATDGRPVHPELMASFGRLVLSYQLQDRRSPR